MNTKALWGLVIALFIIIVVMAYFLVSTPVTAVAPVATTTPTQVDQHPTPTPIATSSAPLSSRVIISTPAKNATLGKTFTVTGKAPGGWYFEASFPIQVRDGNNNKIASAVAQAQGDWMTTAQVPFTATITISGNYIGPATLVLLRDNPSGLPQNDDSVEIPIMIQ